MIHEAQPKPLKLVFPNGLTLWRTDREDNKPPDAKEYSATRIPGTSEGKTKCSNCGAEITIDSYKKRIACPACGKKYEVTMEGKEWTWLWGAAGHTEFAARIKEIRGSPNRSVSKQPRDRPA